MKIQPTLPALIERLLTERLMRQRNVSPHTITSYRDTFRLLFAFAREQLGKSPSSLDLRDIDAPLISRFLDHLETSLISLCGGAGSVRSAGSTVPGRRHPPPTGGS